MNLIWLTCQTQTQPKSVYMHWWANYFRRPLKGSPIVTLVDSESTHNFIQDRTIKFLGLQVAPTKKIHILMERSSHVHLFASRYLTHFLWIYIRCYWLRSRSYLETLEPMLTDYEQLTIKFIKARKLVELKEQNLILFT